MPGPTKRTKVYLDSDLHKALLEDAEDIAAFEDRAGELLVSYDDMVKRLRKDG